MLATLIRLLGDFDTAEEALHEAFTATVEQWPRSGVPDNPHAWLVSTGRFKLIDRWRRQARVAGAVRELAEPLVALTLPEEIHDDELRLIFTCCHPALEPDARSALTLREVGGLTTEEILEARGFIDRALASRRVGPYLLQAAIADLHSTAPSTAETDWPQIVALYDVLRRVHPSPVVELNRAVALGMRDGPVAGLEAVDTAFAAGGLDRYYLAHAARADLQRRLGQVQEARRSYERALELTHQPSEQRFLRSRCAQLPVA